MKIAMLTYSVKPRGGVEHALAVAEALAGRGHEVVLFALARPARSCSARPACRCDWCATCRWTRRSTSASRR